MIQIVKSLLGQFDTEMYSELAVILSDENKPTLSNDELDVFKYLEKEFKVNSQFPTEEVFLLKFPQYRHPLSECDPFKILDLRCYRRQFITKHQNIHNAKMLHSMANQAAVDGITPEMVEAVRKKTSFVDSVEEDNLSFRERYTRNMKDNQGLKTFVDQIDDELGSIPKGALCTLAGFTGSFKTTWAVNMAVKNALEGKNVAYISLEITKEQLEYSILSLYSNDSSFNRMGYRPIEHQLIRQNKLNKDDLDFLCDVLEPKYREKIAPNFHILDRSNFKTYSESEILDALYQLDDEKPIDAIFVDHVGELAFKSPLYNGNNVGAIINKYVSFFGSITVAFRKKENQVRSVTTVLLAQTNRSGYKAAKASYKRLSQVSGGNNVKGKNQNQSLNTSVEGYSLTALSDSNELERFSSVVMSVFADEDMARSSTPIAYVQVLKTRYGQKLPPTPVEIEPAVYKFGGDASIDESSLSADLVGSISSCDIASNRSAGTDITNLLDDDFL